MTVINEGAISGYKAQYDTKVKELLAQTQFLAKIMKRTVREFKDYDEELIADCVEGKPEISAVDVDPGKTNSRIAGTANEDSVAGEGSVRYDIRTYVRLPKNGQMVRIIINVEAQKEFYPGYEIVTRGVYYVARLVSAQKHVEFEKSDYDKIKKVYSIWICMNAPVAVGNAISSYRMTKRDYLGCIPDRPEAYDKMEIVLVALNRKMPTSDEFMNMLNLVFANDKSKQEKLDALRTQYHIRITTDVEEGVNTMCNLSQLLVEEGMEKGREQRLIDIVLFNLKRGMSYEDIGSFLGITVDEVKRLEEKGRAIA